MRYIKINGEKKFNIFENARSCAVGGFDLQLRPTCLILILEQGNVLAHTIYNRPGAFYTSHHNNCYFLRLELLAAGDFELTAGVGSCGLGVSAL